MPVAVPLLAPEWIVAERVGRLDSPRSVRTALSSHPSALQLDVFACGTVVASCRLDTRSDVMDRNLTVGDVVCGCGCRRRAGRVGVRSVAVRGDSVVVGPLVRGVEVSKRVH